MLYRYDVFIKHVKHYCFVLKTTASKFLTINFETLQKRLENQAIFQINEWGIF